MPTDAGGGNMLTKKYGPLPGYVWLGIAVLGYVLWKRMGSSSSLATAGTAGGGAASTITTPSESLTTAGGSYSGPAGQAPPSVTAPGQGGPSPGNGFTPPTNQLQMGSGYGGQPGQVVTDAQGRQFTQSGQTYQAISAAGQAGQAYYETAPGLFAPITYGVASSGASSGAPIFIGPAWQGS